MKVWTPFASNYLFVSVSVSLSDFVFCLVPDTPTQKIASPVGGLGGEGTIHCAVLVRFRISD